MTGTMPDWLAQRAATLPAAEALRSSAGTLTYAELDARATAAAAALASAGVRAGDHVALLAGNSEEFAEVVHALPRLGAVLVPLNTRLATPEIAWQLADANARLLVAHGPTLAVAEEAARAAGLPPPLAIPAPPGRRAARRAPRLEHGERDLHSVMYTSGTTGTPKGAMLTFGNFWASAVGSAFNLGTLPGDRWLACMPLYHVGGLSILLRSAIYGTSAVLHESFDPDRVSRSMRRERITLVSLVATMLRRLLETDRGRAPRGLRAVLVGGGPVPSDLLAEALARGYPVAQTYGLTEAASQVATLAPGDAVARAGSAGKALLTTRLRVDAPAGEAGEILVGGPVVTPGYYGRPWETAAAIRGGWLHTGDIGRLDDDGYLYVLDRRTDLVVSGGENVYPAEVEGVLMAHPAVEGAAVVGLPDPEWGQAVAAAVVVAAAVTDGDLDRWCRARLAAYKVPRRYLRVNALPVTANGKVRRGEVRALFR